MIRRLSWRQDTPAKQMSKLVGEISFYAKSLSVGSYQDLIKRCQVGKDIKDLADQLNEIIKLLPPIDWENK